MTRTLLFALFCAASTPAQDPYRVAAGHYHLVFENVWARATRVTYEPHGTAPVHAHPPRPTTVYVYLTDGGTMRFRHFGDRIAGEPVIQKVISVGTIRFTSGAAGTHELDELGDIPTLYAHIELRTEPLERPVRDVRLAPLSPAKPGSDIQFENGQVRLIRVRCPVGAACPASEHPNDPAVVVALAGPKRGEILWSPAPMTGPAELVRIELKTKPVS